MKNQLPTVLIFLFYFVSGLKLHQVYVKNTPSLGYLIYNFI